MTEHVHNMLRTRAAALRALLRRLELLTHFSQPLAQDAKLESPPVVIVDSAILYQYLEPADPGTAPFTNVAFWEDPAVDLGTIGWIFEESGFTRVLPTPYYREFRVHYEIPVVEDSAEQSIQGQPQALKEPTALVLERLRELRSLRATLASENADTVVGGVYAIRQAVGHLSKVLDLAHGIGGQLQRKLSVVRRFSDLADTGKLVGIGHVLTEERAEHLYNPEDAVRAAAETFLTKHRPRKPHMNAADAEAFAQYVALRKALAERREVYFLTTLDLMQLVPIAIGMDKAEAFSVRHGIRSIGYYAILLAVVGGTGITASEDERSRVLSTIDVWDELIRKLQELQTRSDALVRQDPSTWRVEGNRQAQGILGEARVLALRVQDLFNGMRARASVPGIMNALVQRTRELQKVIEEDAPQAIAKPRRVITELTDVLDGFEANRREPAAVAEQLQKLDHTIDDLSATMKRLLGETATAEAAVRGRVVRSGLMMDGLGRASVRRLIEIVDAAAWGRVRQNEWNNAASRLEDARVRHEIPDDMYWLGRACVELAGWPVWTSSTRPEEPADFLLRMESYLAVSTDIDDEQAVMTRQFAEGQLHYARQRYQEAKVLFETASLWRASPLWVLRYATVVSECAITAGLAECDDDVDAAIGMLDYELQDLRNAGDVRWEAVLENSKVYLQLETRHLSVDYLQSLRERQKHAVRLFVRDLGADLENMGTDYAALLDTQGLCELRLVEALGGSTAGKQALKAASRLFKKASDLNPLNVRIEAHLNELGRLLERQPG